jgi:SAM-dependent methyltransferase
MNHTNAICRICNAQKLVPAISACEQNGLRPECSFNYMRCIVCGGYTLHPIPDDLSTYYAPPYSPHETELSPSVEKLYLELEAAKLEIVRKNCVSHRKVSLLDIGPATGRFLVLAKMSGFKVRGIEQDLSCCESLKRNFGIDIVNSDNPVETLLNNIGQYDIITAFHVIEHLVELKSFLKAVAQAVKPRGYVVLSAPNPKSWCFIVYGRHSHLLDPPRHVSMIPIEALDKIMTDLGCRRIYLTCRDRVARTHNRLSWHVPSALLFRKIFGNKNGGRVWRYLNRLLWLMMWPLDTLPGRGSAYTVVYRKES